jgi:large subunit ribosomal protein L20
MRVKRGNVARKRRKKVLKAAKGYRGSSHSLFKAAAKIRVIKAGVKAYRDRKKKKYAFKAIWIQRLNAAVREAGLSYSKFINLLKKSKIELNRKVLAEIAAQDPEVFKQLIAKVNK